MILGRQQAGMSRHTRKRIHVSRSFFSLQLNTNTGNPNNRKGGKAKETKGAQVAQSVGTGKAKRDAALAKKRGLAATSNPDIAQVDAEVQRSKNQVRVCANR